MALNCSVPPIVICGSEGVIASDTRFGGFTVSRVDPVMPLTVAEMVVLPTDSVVANPGVRVRGPLAMVATAGSEEFQLADAVRS